MNIRTDELRGFILVDKQEADTDVRYKELVEVANILLKRIQKLETDIALLKMKQENRK